MTPLHQPVILLGMHRSGTTMVARLLDDLGLFLGASVQGDHEAVYFLEVNNLLLKNVNATWDNPGVFLSFLQCDQAVEMSVKCLRGDLLGRPVRRYLGLKNYLKARSIDRFDRKWGWKDPRNVYTLPLWLKLFPQAKIINILRNGVDVAASLAHREQEILTMRQRNFVRRYGRSSTRSRLERAGYRGSARCLELSGGFGLWAEYVQRADEMLKTLPNARVTVIYEQFLVNPEPQLRELVRFCELPSVTDERLKATVAQVNAARGVAFLKDPRLMAFYQTVRDHPFMVQYGYDQLA